MSALPSGTTISAADINVHLKRTSGTAVNWNTTVRTLSATTTGTPDLNSIRGTAAHGLYYATGATSDTYAQTDYAGVFTAAFNIPGTPWRLVARGYPSSNSGVGGNVLELIVLGTGYRVKNIYRNLGLGLPLSHPSGTMYPGADWNFAMLSNGKFVIAYSLSNSVAQWTGWYGLGFTVLTFNTDGTIASTNNYFTKLASTLTSAYGGDQYLIANRREDREMSTNGTTCAFSLETGVVKIIAIKFDGSGSSPVIRYTVCSNGVSTGTDYVAPGPNTGNLHPVVISDGTINVIRGPGGTSEGIMNCKLNAAGTAWSNSGTRVKALNASDGATYVPIYPLTASPATVYWPLASQPTQQYGYAMASLFTDKSLDHNIRNYFAIRTYVSSMSNMQIQGSPYTAKYYNGTLSGILIQKVNADTNAIKYSISMTCETPYLWTSSTDKYGAVTYTYYNPHSINQRSVLAVRTDSSDNTYFIIRTLYMGPGGNYSTTYDSYRFGAISVPQAGMQYYSLIKISSSGAKLWQKDFDLGARAAGKSYGYPYAYTGAGPLDSVAATWSILIREEIDVVEVYATYGTQQLSSPWSLTSPNWVSRSAHFHTSDGGALSNNSGNASLNVFTLVQGTLSLSDQFGATIYCTQFPIFIATRTNVTPESNTNNYTSLSTYTETLSVNSTTAFFVANPTTTLLTGTAYVQQTIE